MSVFPGLPGLPGLPWLPWLDGGPRESLPPGRQAAGRRRSRNGTRAVRALVGGLCGVVAACGPPAAPPPMRLWTDDIAFQVTADPAPPHAREDVVFKVVARDKASGQPIEGAEGRIYATSRDGANVWDALTAGPQAGTYYGKLHFITAGDWALGMQFRRDTTRAIERLDWRQQVWAATGEAVIR